MSWHRENAKVAGAYSLKHLSRCYPASNLGTGHILSYCATSDARREAKTAAKPKHLKVVENSVKRPVSSKGRKANAKYRVREHLTEAEMGRLLDALKGNRHGHRDWLIGLLIYRHGLRVSEACDLRWDDGDLAKRTIIVRRLKGSDDSAHYLERDEVAGLKRLQREQEPKASFVFVNERGQPFGRMGIARMIERAGEAAELPFPVHVHMLRHSTGYALAAKGMDMRRLQHFLGHASITNTVRYTAMSPEPFKDIWR
jgi:site-specific recombinase XerD